MTGVHPPFPSHHAWPARRPPHPRAAPSLVLGIVGLTGIVLVLPLAVSPLAWYLGAVARRQTEREEPRWSPSPMATAGVVLGAIGTVLLVAGALVMGGVALLTGVLMGTDTGYGP